jgi:hypothetical protein
MRTGARPSIEAGGPHATAGINLGVCGVHLAAQWRRSSRHRRPLESRLAMLPGTTHVTLAGRADWLLSMISDVSQENGGNGAGFGTPPDPAGSSGAAAQEIGP